MVTPTAPVTSTSSTKSKKPKKPTTKPSKEPAKIKIADAASSTDDDETYSELIASTHEESPDPPLAYVPPAGSVPADFDVDVDFGEFDYDAVKAEEGAELWLVRAPNEVRPILFLSYPTNLLRKKINKFQVRAKNLQGIQVLSSPSSIVGRVGELSRKSIAYDIWSLSASSSSSASIGDSHHPHVCAEELNGLSVLLPRKRKDGKLFLGAYDVPAFPFDYIFRVLTNIRSAEARHATPRRHCAPRRAYTTQFWRRDTPKPSARGVP